MGILERKIFRSGPFRDSLLLPSLMGGMAAAASPLVAADDRPVGAPEVAVDPDSNTTLPSHGVGAYVLNTWRKAYADECAQPGEVPTSPTESALQEIYQSLRDSQVGQALVAAAGPGDVTMCDDVNGWLKDGTDAYYVHGFQTTFLDLDNSQYGPHVLVEMAAHENRHAMQHRNPALDPFRMANPRDALGLTYIIEADASAHQLAVAWQREQAGHQGAWNPARFGEDTPYFAMAKAFEGVMDKAAAQGDGLENQPQTLRKAMAASFHAWFADENRREFYARNALAGYQKTQILNKGAYGDDTSWQRNMPRPEQLVGLTGHVAGDSSGVAYLTPGDMRTALDHVPKDYKAYGWADTFEAAKTSKAPPSAPIVPVLPSTEPEAAPAAKTALKPA